MKLQECISLIYADLSRISHNLDSYSRLKKLIFFIYSFFNYITFRFIFFYRLSSYLYNKGVLTRLLYFVVYLIYTHYSYKLGIILMPKAKIGGGLSIPHYPSIVLASAAKYGRNFTVFQQVTVGLVYNSKNEGAPIIGDNVVLSAGAKIVGNVKIGNFVMIGAGAVVTHDIPDNAVVVGNPGRIISFNGYEKVKPYLGNLI